MVSANDIQYGGDHYKKARIQHWDFVVDNNLGYLEGCSTKYLSRHQDKNGLEDVQKAEHYIQKILEKHLQDGYRNGFTGEPQDIHSFIEGTSMDGYSATVFFMVCWWRGEEDLLCALDNLPGIKSLYHYK